MRIVKNIMKICVPILTALAASLLPGAVTVRAITDYRAMTLYYSATYLPIAKPTAALTISSGGASASDAGSITVSSGARISLSAAGCSPGSADSIAEYDFQYYNPASGYTLGNAVPSEMTLTTPGTWMFYLCVRGSIPSSMIYGQYDDWSDNGSHSAVGSKNSETMYWHFVEITVNVVPTASVPDFFIYHDGIDVTGGVINADTLPVNVSLMDNSRNAISCEWFIKTPGHADFVPFSSMRNPQADIYTAGLEYFKLRINRGSEVVKQVYVNMLKIPVAVIKSQYTAATNEWIDVSGLDSYSMNSGGFIVTYQWNTSGAEGTLSSADGTGAISYAAPGRYAVRLTVTDNFGKTSTEAILYIDVADKPPVQSFLPPIADFSLAKNEIGTDEALAITDNSRTAGSLEIITMREWVVEQSGNDIYSGNVPKTTFATPGSYVISLRVKSSNGLWSAPADHDLWTRKSFTVIVIDRIPPDVSILPTSVPWTNKEVNYTIKAKDSGSAVSRIRYIATLFSDMASIPPPIPLVSVAATTFNGKLNTEGIWYVFAGATDAMHNISPFVRGGPYRIDMTPPTIAASNTSVTGAGSVDISLSAADTGGSGVNHINYSWSALAVKPLNWQRCDAASAQTSIAQAGAYYLHVEAFDKAGNSEYICFGPYSAPAITVRIDDVTIEGARNYWNGAPDASGRSTTCEPHRFMSLETVRINIFTSGYADRVVIRFDPELESMHFTDSSGNIYSYMDDFFGYEIEFPADSTCMTDSASDTSHVYWEYALPLAGSTKDFETGSRIGPSYSMRVTVYKGTESTTRVIDDIDITGNVLDHIIIQPK